MQNGTLECLRALMALDHVPAGSMLVPVVDDDSEPHLRAGEFAVVDLDDVEPQHGELYLIRFNARPAIQQLVAKSHRHGDDSFVGFWTRCLNFERYSSEAGVFISHRTMSDGPRRADEMRKAIVGRVIGYYSPAGS